MADMKEATEQVKAVYRDVRDWLGCIEKTEDQAAAAALTAAIIARQNALDEAEARREDSDIRRLM